MAVRFNADGQDYNASLSLGSQSQWSVTCWVKIVVDTNNFATVWAIGTSGSDHYECVTDSNGTTLRMYDDLGTFRNTGRALTVGTWYFVGVSVNGTAGTFITRAAAEASFTASNWASGGSSSTNLATFRLQDDFYGNNWLNGSVTAVKVWSGIALSQTELEREAVTYRPIRIANLQGWYPLMTPGTADYSGKNHPLSGGSGVSADSVGPPVWWGTASPVAVLPAGVSIAGDVAAVLPALESADTASVVVEAAATGSLPALTVSAAGQATAAGDLTAALPPPAIDGAAAAKTTGAAAAGLPALAADLNGDLHNQADITAVLPAAAATAEAASTAQATAPIVLPAASSAIGADTSVSAAVDARLPTLQAAAAAELHASTSADLILPALATGLTGDTDTPAGSLDAALPSAGIQAAGAVRLSGAHAAVLPAPAAAVSGRLPAGAVVEVTFPTLVASVGGTVDVPNFGTVTCSLASVDAALSGGLPAFGELAVTLPAVTSAFSQAPTYPPDRIATIPVDPRSAGVAREDRAVTLPADDRVVVA